MGGEKILRTIIIAGVFLLLLTPLFVSTSLFFPYITGKAFLFRIIVEVVFVAWLVLIWFYPSYRPHKSPVLFAVLALTAVTALATIFGINPYHSFWSNFERMDGLVSSLHLGALFLVIASIFTTTKLWRYFLHMATAISLIVGLMALKDLHSGGAVRLAGTLGNPIYLAVYMLVHFCLSLLMIWNSKLNRWTVGLYSLAALFQLSILYLTATRSAILGLAIGLVVALIILTILGRDYPRARKFSLIVLVVVVVLGSIFYFFRQSPLIQSRETLSRFANISLTDATTRHRLYNWGMAWRGFTERPLLGWGPENYITVFNKYYDHRLYDAEMWFDRSHNIFLDWLVGTGLLGLLAYLGLFVAAFYELFKRWKQKLIATPELSIIIGLLVAYAVNNLFVFDNLTSSLLFMIVLALIINLAPVSELKVQPKTNRFIPIQSGQVLLVSTVAIIILIPLIYYLNIKPLTDNQRLLLALNTINSSLETSTKKIDLFEQIFSGGTFARTEAAEQLLFSLPSLASSNSLTNEQKSNLISRALNLASDQIKIDPNNARLNLFMGEILINLSQPQLALGYLEQAQKLAPNRPTMISAVALAHQALGQKVKAFALASQAYNLEPRFDPSRQAFINIGANNKKYQEIIPALELEAELSGAKDKTQNLASLAAGYLLAGNRAKAISTIEAAIKDNPDFATQGQQLIRDIQAGRNPVGL